MKTRSTSNVIEKELALKLLSTLHLNVEERSVLPNGRVRLSVAEEAVAERLSANGWFPSDPGPLGALGDRALIEKREGSIWLHERFETGVGSFSPIESKKIHSLRKAIRLYIKHYGGSPIDGVEIDRWA